ncbi:universal stress protein [Halapricum salinum]|uniref:Universal stress protein n=1 Tax=Halapricum salinum TaxID=1457250 RepID=A0A4D6HDA9_9EURY|nr:universal stress protein [Halapricum salinum]QCC51790.1 universal stress protein [Halapricum salinum]
MYSDILYPTDDSEGATAARENVRDLAETYGATVHVMHVVDTPEGMGGMADDRQSEHDSAMSGGREGESTGMAGSRTPSEAVQRDLLEQAERIVEETAAQLEGIETETIVARGTPHEAILDRAADGIDIIVMGTHGRTGLDRYLLGSVTEKVVRLSDVPVMTVRQKSSA